MKLCARSFAILSGIAFCMAFITVPSVSQEQSSRSTARDDAPAVAKRIKVEMPGASRSLLSPEQLQNLPAGEREAKLEISKLTSRNPLPRSNSGAVLYNNGPLVTNPGPPDTSFLQNSTLGMTTLGFGHQNPPINNRIADDFTITDPGGWQIDSMCFFAYQTGSPTTSTIDTVNYRIWDGPPNDPLSSVVFSDTATNRLIATVWSGIYRMSQTSPGTTRPIMQNTASAGLFLPPGTYWLDWQTGGMLTSGPWAPPITIIGDTMTGNALQYIGSSSTWQDARDGGIMTQQGFPFIIKGSVIEIGPDAWGYTAVAEAFEWVDIRNTGAMVSTGDDESSASPPPAGIGGPVTLGAPFTLYGITYTELVVSTNGYITTDPADQGPDVSNDCPIPATPSSPGGTTGARIYPLHDDLDCDTSEGPGKAVYYQYFPVSPRPHPSGTPMGVSVFQWHGSHFPGGAAVDTFSLQALLYDNGDMIFQVGAGNPEQGSGSTTGLQNWAPPNIGLNIICNTPGSVPDNTAVLVIAPPVSKELAATLDGSQQVPPVTTTGTGTGAFTLNGDSTALAYEISVQNVPGTIAAAHFHNAPAGSNGPVVRTIFGGAISGDATFSGTWTSGDTEPLTTALVDELCAGRLYINVHTMANPGGEIRGQISILVDVEEAIEGIAQTYELVQNYPNPFNPSTVIRFGVPTQSSVSLKIYNILGQEIATLVDEVKSAGNFKVQWKGTNQFGSQVASGVYLYRLEAEAVDGSTTFRDFKRMLFVK